MTQEVFLRALQNRALIESFTSGQCKAWLFAAARNLYCDQVRRAAREQQLLETLCPGPQPDTPDETAADALERVDLNSLLEQLPPEDRQLFLLRYQHGWNATQLGQQWAAASHRPHPPGPYPGPPATRNGGLNV